MTKPSGSGPEEEAASRSEPDDLQYIVHHAALPHTGLSGAADAVIRGIGSWISWIWIALIAVIMVNVTMRYAFGEGRVEFEEIQWHIYSVGFLFGLSYCLAADDHVRVDLLYERFGPKTKAWVELLGIVFLLAPFLVLVIWYAVPFVAYSFDISETSEAPGGLSRRWVIKSMLVVGFFLLAVAALSRLSRVCSLLFGFPASRSSVRSN
ncbi:MAG TPA: TRAP transporter small permease subunit [Gammaproteobacteria bacterium]